MILQKLFFTSIGSGFITMDKGDYRLEGITFFINYMCKENDHLIYMDESYQERLEIPLNFVKKLVKLSM